MKITAKRSAEAQFRQICLSGLNGKLVLPELLRVLHVLVPWANCGVFWADDCGQIKQAYIAVIASETLIQGFFDCLPRIECELMIPFSEAIHLPEPVFPLDRLLRVERRVWLRHELYHELSIPLHIECMLHAPLKTSQGVIGLIAPSRTLLEPAFTDGEKQILARLAPFVAHALLAEESFHDAWTDSPEQGLVILNREGQVKHASQTATRLLYYLHWPRSAIKLSFRAKVSNAAMFQEKLFRKFAECMCNPNGRVPIFTNENDWGRLTLRGYWLEPEGKEGEGLIGVIVQGQEPLSLKLIRALSEKALSLRERDIALRMCLGDSYPEIAKKFHLSHRTVIAHSQSILNKLGIAKRTELGTQLLYGTEVK